MHKTEIRWFTFLCVFTEPLMTICNKKVEFLIFCLKHLMPLFVIRILSKHPAGQMLAMVFGTYAGKLSFLPLSTFVTYK